MRCGSTKTAARLYVLRFGISLRVGFKVSQISTQPGRRLPGNSALCVKVPHRITGSFGVCEDSGKNGVPMAFDAITPNITVVIFV
jgi:hypothetical protein